MSRLTCHRPCRNEYWQTTRPVAAWTHSGQSEPTNCSYGSSRIYRAVWTPTSLPAGTPIELLHGGNFARIGGERVMVRFDDPANDPGPFERRPGFDANAVPLPLEALTRVQP